MTDDDDTRHALAAIALCRHVNREDAAAVQAILDDPDLDPREIAASVAGALVLYMRDAGLDVDADLADQMAVIGAGANGSGPCP